MEALMMTRSGAREVVDCVPKRNNALLLSRSGDILFCMSTYTYPIRLSREDRVLFKQSARAEGMTLASWLRQAARDRAKRVNKKSWACLTYPDWPLSDEAAN